MGGGTLRYPCRRPLRSETLTEVLSENSETNVHGLSLCRGGGNRSDHGDVPSPRLPAPRSQPSIASPSLPDHTHLPHTPAHTPSSASTCATPNTTRGRTTANNGGTTTNCARPRLRFSGGGYKPTLASDQDGGELAHSRDPGFVVVAIFLRVYRQASRYVLLLFTLASSMTCLPLVTLARYRWHYISHLGPFSYGISQRRYGVSREQAAVHHPYGDRSSTSSYPLRYPCSLLAYDTRV